MACGDQSNATTGETAPPGEVTRLLASCSGGDRKAFDRLFVVVYDDLRRIARRRMQVERENHTLDTTAVVHEAYLSLVDQAATTWRDRAHFFAIASRVIRHVLIDYARTRAAAKRGGGTIRVPLREEIRGREPATISLLELDEALRRLADRDPRLERVVECRFFGGMSVKDTAEAIGVSPRTVERAWTKAKAYLYEDLA